MLLQYILQRLPHSPNIAMDFSQKEITQHNYSTPDDEHDQGLLAHEEVYQSNATDGLSGVPGTDSNSETDYMIDESSGTRNSTYERKSDYLPNEEIIKTTEATGKIVYNDSSISVAAVRYRVVREVFHFPSGSQAHNYHKCQKCKNNYNQHNLYNIFELY